MARTTATVLFTDLVASTDLRTRLGESRAEDLRRSHDRLLTDAVQARGGQVIKGLGDGIMATFAGATDAVAAAIAIQQGIDRLNRAGTVAMPVAVRVGLSAGDVSFEEDDVHGRPVIEAARLCSTAGGGEILVSDTVRLLARAGDTPPFVPIGALELKGLSEPVPAARVEWEPAASAVPVPGLLTETGRIFVGRDAELGRLRQLWKEVTAGERRLALVAGEPGVGKTRLAAEFAAGLHAEGATVLAGRCDEDLGVPYQPFVEALRHFVDHTPPEELAGSLGRYGGELARLVPELAVAVPGLPPPLTSDPETERYRLFDSVAAWLAALSAPAPVLVVLDDLQWAAKPTLLLLRHLVRWTEPIRVLVVAIYRDTELSHDHPLVNVLADLRQRAGVKRLSLNGLDRAEVAAFVEQAAGLGKGEDTALLARAIYAETEGNPFFVREVVRHLGETGTFEGRPGPDDPLWVEALGIPESVREVVGRRLARLSTQANQVLGMAAVAGLEFELPVVRSAGGFDEEEVLSGLEEAIAARLLFEVPGTGLRFRFAHSLLRDTLYGGVSAARRTALHRRVAEAIEKVHAPRLHAHLPALAHHWSRASAPAAETAKATDYAIQAGDWALAQLAHDEAVTYYRQALELLDASGEAPDSPLHLELAIKLGEAQRRAGDATHRQTLLDAAALAVKRSDARALAEAALANERGYFSATGRVDRDRITVLEAALDAVSGDDSGTRARLLANLASELVFASDNQRRAHLAGEALAMARRLGDPATLGHVVSRQFTAVVPASLEELRGLATQLTEAVGRLDDPALRFWARHWSAFTALSVGDPTAFDEEMSAAARLAGELGQPFFRWVISFVTSNQARIAGRLAEAEAHASEGLEVGRAAGIPDAFRVFGANLFWIRYDQGRLDTLAELLERAATREHRDALTIGSLAVTHCELGRAEQARTVFDELAANGFNDVPRNWFWLYGMTLAGEVAARLADADRAALIYDRLAPRDRFVAHTWASASGPVAHYLGHLATTLGRFDEADAHFRDAEAIARRMEAPTWLARTRVEWAALLLSRRQRGDAERARELLGQALAAAGELGLAAVERRAAALRADRP